MPLFRAKALEREFIFVYVDVDDLIISSPSQASIRETKEALASIFSMKDMGPIHN
jgi:hypothetical protein